MRQVVFRASGLLVRFAPQMAGADLMTGGLAGTVSEIAPNKGTETEPKHNITSKIINISEITPN